MISLGIIMFWGAKFYKDDKFLGIITIGFFIVGILYVGVSGYSLLAIINAILLVIFFKKIYQNKPLFILMVAAFLLSLKTFFTVNIDVYGTYTLPFLIFSLLGFVYNIKFSEKEHIRNAVKLITYTVLTFPILLLSIGKSTDLILKKQYPINVNTPVFTFKYIAKPLNDVISFINEITKPTDSGFT